MTDPAPRASKAADPQFDPLIIGESRVLRARADLNAQGRIRLVDRALNDGHQTRDIASMLGVPLKAIERMARRLRAGYDPAAVTPSEIINRYVAGEISSGTMLQRILESDLAFGVHDPTGGNHYKRGTWDEVASAAGRGLLTEAQYNHLLSQLPQSPTGDTATPTNDDVRP